MADASLVARPRAGGLRDRADRYQGCLRSVPQEQHLLHCHLRRPVRSFHLSSLETARYEPLIRGRGRWRLPLSGRGYGCLCAGVPPQHRSERQDFQSPVFALPGERMEGRGSDLAPAGTSPGVGLLPDRNPLLHDALGSRHVHRPQSSPASRTRSGLAGPSLLALLARSRA